MRAVSRSPAASRRHAAGADSARGLLFTVLGEFMLPTGAAPTSAFIKVLGQLGVEEKATRQALTRTGADGSLVSERRGRRTVWRLTEATQRFLTDGAERIYGFRASQPVWDGRWLIVLARLPETERAARHLLRTRLTWAGFGSPAPGVWISTHADRAPEAERVLGEAGVHDGQIFRAEHHGGGKLSVMVHQSWDLDAVDVSYEDFLADFAGPPAGDPLIRMVRLVHAWRRFPRIDPALPIALLPTRWSGVRAADLFARRHAEWHAAAQAEWHRVTATTESSQRIEHS